MLTLVLIVLTVGVSLWGFSDERRLNQLLFNAYAVWHRRQWYRMLSYGLIHAGWGHLIFNMLTLYFSRSPVVETARAVT